MRHWHKYCFLKPQSDFNGGVIATFRRCFRVDVEYVWIVSVQSLQVVRCKSPIFGVSESVDNHCKLVCLQKQRDNVNENWYWFDKTKFMHVSHIHEIVFYHSRSHSRMTSPRAPSNLRGSLIVIALLYNKYNEDGSVNCNKVTMKYVNCFTFVIYPNWYKMWQIVQHNIKLCHSQQ